MKSIITLTILSVALVSACAGQKTKKSAAKSDQFAKPKSADILRQVFKDDSEEVFCFINQKGDTIAPFGRFSYSFSEKITSYGIVIEDAQMIGINNKGEKIFDAYMFDNGPDYIEDGLIRIKKGGKVGYANGKTGKIVIEPKFDCAYPFADGKAKVALDCTLEKDGEYTMMKSDSWIWINKKGEEVK